MFDFVSDGSNDYGVPQGPKQQGVLNQSWPPPDVARRLKDRPDSIAVRVRLVLEVDGEEWIDGMARRWYGRHVCVEHADPRPWVRYAWVDASDVVRA